MSLIRWSTSGPSTPKWASGSPPSTTRTKLGDGRSTVTTPTSARSMLAVAGVLFRAVDIR